MIDYVELSDAAVDGELVVDLRYKNLVIDRLRQLQTPVTVAHSRENETLDLALLSLRGVGKIDTVLAELRSWFTENFGGERLAGTGGLGEAGGGDGGTVNDRVGGDGGKEE